MSAIQSERKKEEKFEEKSSELAESQLVKLSSQMDVFRRHLQEFAGKHRKEIRKDPGFRRSFQEMCASVGVDPLQSSNNFWSKVLGVGNFYYELAVQIVEVCMATCHRNGGIMSIEELLTRVKGSRNVARVKSSSASNDEITIDDILRAIEKLSKLGGGIKAIPSGKTFIIQSVAAELSMDNLAVMSKAQQSGGHVDQALLMDSLRWTPERAEKALNDLVMEAIVWIDKQTPTGTIWYWFPGLV